MIRIGNLKLSLDEREELLTKKAARALNISPHDIRDLHITKKAVDMYIAEIEKSDMPIDAKMYAMMNAKKQLKQMKNQKQIAEIAMQLQAALSKNR